LFWELRNGRNSKSKIFNLNGKTKKYLFLKLEQKRRRKASHWMKMLRWINLKFRDGKGERFQTIWSSSFSIENQSNSELNYQLYISFKLICDILLLYPRSAQSSSCSDQSQINVFSLYFTTTPIKFSNLFWNKQSFELSSSNNRTFHSSLKANTSHPDSLFAYKVLPKNSLKFFMILSSNLTQNLLCSLKWIIPSNQ
jgi:hypothetical protein